MNTNLHNTGAIPALRGFRTQFLYTLYRILISEPDEVIYPELEEDYSIKNQEELTEVTQVKNHRSPLTLSDLASKDNSFFKRNIQLLNKESVKTIRLVSFGPLGSDLLDLQKQDHTDLIISKLDDHYGIIPSDSIPLLQRLSVISVSEEILTKQVLDLLSETLVGTDTVLACDILLFWLYKVAELRQAITMSALIEKIETIGQFINERHEFLKEFGRGFIPVRSQFSSNDLENLTQEYFSGIAAKYEHIQHHLDISRPEKINEIDRAFLTSNVVILHGASGQGKSTLAYRYIHERFPDGYAYEIKTITGLPHILDLSQAIRALSRPFDSTFLILIDVMPGDTNWGELVKRLTEIERCQILVTIREEDLNRSVSLDEFVKSSQVKLGLSVDEASQIFSQFIEKEGTSPNFLNFTDAWSKFDGGPLLEFTFFLRKGERLRVRLKNQLSRIQTEAIQQADPDQIKLLRYIAVSGAHDCRIDLKKLLGEVNLNNSQRSIFHFENEYLVRISDGGRIVEALHPVRAQIMADELCDEIIEPVSENLKVCLPIIIEGDLGNYILQFAYAYGWSENMMEKLLELQLTSWKSCKDILTSLIWCGVNDYIKKNKKGLDQLKIKYPQAYEIATLMLISPKVDLSILDKYSDNVSFKEIKYALTELDPIEDFYKYVKTWLCKSKLPKLIDTSVESEVRGLGYLLFWLGSFKIRDRTLQSVLSELENMNLSQVSLDASADLLLGLQYVRVPGAEISDKLLYQFLQEFQIREQVIEVEDDLQNIKIHLFFDLNDFTSNENNSNPFHSKTLHAIQLIRKAFPLRQTYCSQGHGHRIHDFHFLPDDTQKNIPAENLPLPWNTEANGFFYNLIKWESRPDDWSTMMNELISTKAMISETLREIIAYIKNISKSPKLKVRETEIPTSVIERISGQLPKEAVDKWGFTGENIEKYVPDQVYHKIPLVLLIEPNLRPSLEAVDDFITPFQNFIVQLAKSLIRKDVTQGWSSNDLKVKEVILRESGYPVDVYRLSKFNLTELLAKVGAYEKGVKQILELHSISLEQKQPNDLKAALGELCLLWPYFLELRKYHIQEIEGQYKLKEKSIVKEFEVKLQSQLQILKSTKLIEECEFIVSEKYNGRCYIILYVDRWEQYLTTLDKIQQILIQCLEPCPLLGFKRIVLERRFSTFWIIPLFDDYLLSRTAINISLYNILDSKEAFKLSMIGIVSDEMIIELEIEEASKAFIGFGNPERFIGLVKTIGMTLDHLAQLEVLYGRNNVGNLLLSAHSTKMILDTHAQFKEVEELISILFQDIELELKSPSPIIPEKMLVEYVLSMREQIARLFSLDSINEDGCLNLEVFKLFVEIDLKLKEGNELLMIAYWTWLEIVIKKYLWN